MSRVVDRKLGARALLNSLHQQFRQLANAMTHALNQQVRSRVANLLVDVCTLIGWLCLDTGALLEAWTFYEHAKTAAREAGSPGLHAYACAAQSVVLLDIGRLAEAQELVNSAVTEAGRGVPAILMAWLTAAQGEAYAAHGNRTLSLRAFDRAHLLLDDSDPADAPYLVFDNVQLMRWRGSALAELGELAAVDKLNSTLDALDADFTRARAATHADFAKVLFVHGEREAAVGHAKNARDLAMAIGSARQYKRVRPHLSDA